MSDGTLGTYLNDHLAGSVGAVELLERAIRENEGDPIAGRLEGILAEIRQDQAVLQELIQQVGAAESPLKKAGAWLAEKAGRVKLGATDEPRDLSRLEVLEMLTMGIRGKQALWRALRTVAGKYPPLSGLDFDRLEHRAVEQHDRVEALRLEAARDAL
ncbi:MAG TPA: hypothetical protein VHG35_03705 [Gemmatimonadales bacterium]|nr:hypothetical protein [Gemmatimonadales bacterium]